MRDVLKKLKACESARAWASTYTDGRAAWNACPRGDWLLWLCSKVGIDRRVTSKISCNIAGETLRYLPPDELSARAALRAADECLMDRASRRDVIIAIEKMYARPSTQSGSFTVKSSQAAIFHAASSVGYEHCKSYGSVDRSMFYVEFALYAAAEAHGYAAGDSNLDQIRDENLARYADLVRRHVTYEEIEAHIQAMRTNP